MAGRVRTCAHCADSLTGRRIDARYCSDACRKRAARRRARRVPVDAFPEGWRRGPLRLGRKTKLEKAYAAGYRDAREKALIVIELLQAASARKRT